MSRILSNNESIPRIMITLRCNLNCPYCSTPRKNIPEQDAHYWIDLINRMSYKEIRISGGEPLLYRGLFEVLSGIRSKYYIYTNLTLLAEEMIGKLHPDRCTLFISYHEEGTDKGKFLRSLDLLLERGIPIYDVHYVKNSPQEFLGRIRERGVTLTQVEDQHDIPRQHGTFCLIDRTLLGPDGRRYPCMTYLTEGENPIDINTHNSGRQCSRDDCTVCDVACYRRS